jgi:mRNA interferase RelE/StbE
MGSYKIELRQSAGRDIRKITPTLIPNILRKIEALSSEPFPRQSLKLSGGEATYRLRVGDYRVIYEVDNKTRAVVIHYVRHRREVYR